jgi:hypothetical protein
LVDVHQLAQPVAHPIHAHGWVGGRVGGGCARRREAGIAHAGTLGLIVQARKRGRVPSARTLFAQLMANDFRVAPEPIRAALAEAGEAQAG